jgi:hypothetical protein
MITDSLGPVSFGLFIVAVLGTLALGAGYVLTLLLKQTVWARWILRLALRRALRMRESFWDRFSECLNSSQRRPLRILR